MLNAIVLKLFRKKYTHNEGGDVYEDPETGELYASKRVYEIHQLKQAIQRGELHTIEEFSLYTMLPDGTVVNIDRARPVKPFWNGRRLGITLVSDDGKRKTLSLARLVASHLLTPPDADQYYDVVFKDGDVRNVNPSNLEWQPRWKRHADPGNYDLDL